MWKSSVFQPRPRLKWAGPNVPKILDFLHARAQYQKQPNLAWRSNYTRGRFFTQSTVNADARSVCGS